MKFRVTMKDPDTLDDAIADAVADISVPGLSDEEMEEVRMLRRGKISSLCSRWFEYGEYLTVEIDTEAETCTVVPNRS